MGKKTQSPKERISGHTICPLLLAATLYTIALPPVGLWGVIFFVPAVWARLIRSDRFSRSRWNYGKTYIVSLLFWLLATFWICFPHPLTSLGWVALSTYLAIYLPLFIGLSRRITTRLNLPIFLVAPVLWVALEWFRNHVFGGFSLAAPEHALFRVPLLIQTADLGGQYAVAFFLVLAGCCLEQVVSGSFQSVSFRSEEESTQNHRRNDTRGNHTLRTSPRVAFCVGFVSTAFVLSYAYVRTDGNVRTERSKEVSFAEQPVRVAVLQGNSPVMLNPPEELYGKTLEQFAQLSREAVEASQEREKPLDLIIWGETVYPFPIFDFEEGFVLPQWRGQDLPPDEIRDIVTRRSWEQPLALARSLSVNLLLGAGVVGYKKGDAEEDGIRYNSAVLVDPVANTVGPRYDKMHLVMFGEYVPFAEYLPDDFPLKTLCQTSGRGSRITGIPLPLRSSVNRSEQGCSRGEIITVAPNICFECFVPHLIARQVRELKRQGCEPDILVNLSNVGWFRFTSEIDFQLAAQVFRAVEQRKPYLTATNSGISAFIDGSGRLVREGSRRKAMFLIAEVRRDVRGSFYGDYGDVFAYGCLCVAAGFLVISRSGKESKGNTARDNAAKNSVNPLSARAKNG